jgi:hypothetical protein
MDGGGDCVREGELQEEGDNGERKRLGVRKGAGLIKNPLGGSGIGSCFVAIRPFRLRLGVDINFSTLCELCWNRECPQLQVNRSLGRLSNTLHRQPSIPQSKTYASCSSWTWKACGEGEISENVVSYFIGGVNNEALEAWLKEGDAEVEEGTAGEEIR